MSALRAKGVAPFWVDVFADANLTDTASFASFLAGRQATAVALEPSPTGHRGRLSFVTFASLDRLCALRSEAGGRIEEVMVDVWLHGVWVSRFGSTQAELWNKPCFEIDGSLRTDLVQAADDILGPEPDALTFTVYGATIVLPDSGLAVVAMADDVLLFDPEDDLLAPWLGHAFQVRLATPVDAFGSWIALKVQNGELTNPFVPAQLETLP
jgi:hypothetical protein